MSGRASLVEMLAQRLLGGASRRAETTPALREALLAQTAPESFPDFGRVAATSRGMIGEKPPLLNRLAFLLRKAGGLTPSGVRRTGRYTGAYATPRDDIPAVIEPEAVAEIQPPAQALDAGRSGPARVYRGMDRPYDPTRAGRDHEWYAADPETANTYAGGEGGNVMPANLDLQNPLRIDAGGAGYGGVPVSAISDSRVRARLVADMKRDGIRDRSTAWTDDIADAAKAAGYDGIIFDNIVDPAMSNMPGVHRPTTIYGSFRRDAATPAFGRSHAPDGNSSVAPPEQSARGGGLWRGSDTGGGRGGWATPDRQAAAEYGRTVRPVQGDASGALEVRDLSDVELAVGEDPAASRALSYLNDGNADVWDALELPEVQAALRSRGHRAVRLADDVAPSGRRHESVLFLDRQPPNASSGQGSALQRALRERMRRE